MKIGNSITFKIFAILAVLMTVFVSIVIYAQLFVVSRSYLTTDYMKRRQDELSKSLVKFEDKYISDDIKKSSYILNNMADFESQNEACILILDSGYNVKYADDYAREKLSNVT